MARSTSIQLPRGGEGDKFAIFSPEAEAIVTDSKVVDGEMVVVTLGSLPIGCNQLTMVPRRCGDWYCEIYAGKTAVAAVGDNREAAFATASSHMAARLRRAA